MLKCSSNILKCRFHVDSESLSRDSFLVNGPVEPLLGSWVMWSDPFIWLQVKMKGHSLLEAIRILTYMLLTSINISFSNPCSFSGLWADQYQALEKPIFNKQLILSFCSLVVAVRIRMLHSW